MIQDHIKDVDFRTREERQKVCLPEFIGWYSNLVSQPYSERNQGQLTMLSSVLWYLLPVKEYKKLVTSNKGLK